MVIKGSILVSVGFTEGRLRRQEERHKGWGWRGELGWLRKKKQKKDQKKQQKKQQKKEQKKQQKKEQKNRGQEKEQLLLHLDIKMNT